LFDVNEIDETELTLLPKIEGTSEIEARKILTKSLAEIGKLTPEAWEFEKLAIVEADIISESKLEKIRKLATSGQLVKTQPIEWQDQLTRDEDEKVKGKIYNIDLILNNDPKYQNIFKYDNFSQSIVLYNRPMDILGLRISKR
jgi:hypothetical protein